jgi:hypothetical protein
MAEVRLLMDAHYVPPCLAEGARYWLPPNMALQRTGLASAALKQVRPLSLVVRRR